MNLTLGERILDRVPSPCDPIPESPNWGHFVEMHGKQLFVSVSLGCCHNLTQPRGLNNRKLSPCSAEP